MKKEDAITKKTRRKNVNMEYNLLTEAVAKRLGGRSTGLRSQGALAARTKPQVHRSPEVRPPPWVAMSTPRKPSNRPRAKHRSHGCAKRGGKGKIIGEKVRRKKKEVMSFLIKTQHFCNGCYLPSHVLPCGGRTAHGRDRKELLQL